MVTAREMGKSLGNYVKAYCKNGDLIEGMVANYVRPEDNYPFQIGQIEIERQNCYIVLKQHEVDRLEIYDRKTGLAIKSEPTGWEKFKYFMLGKDINK